MDLYARVNIMDGRSVRLPHGNVADAIVLDSDPLARAQSWVEAGADRIHLVDLDAAAFREYGNRPLIDEIINALDVPVQVAGGIRSPLEAQRNIDAGAWRIVMGTAAIEDQNMVWDLCRDHPGKIVVSIDVRPDGEIATRGWTMNSGRYLEEVLIEMSSAGAAAIVLAEAGRDALEDGPDLRLHLEALEAVDVPVIAGGGVRNLDDLRDLVRLQAMGRGLDGIIVGREVTSGRFTVEEAKKVLIEIPADQLTQEIIETPKVPRSLAKSEAAFKKVAEELERAAAAAREAVKRIKSSDVDAAMSRGLAISGHLQKADEVLSKIAKRHAFRDDQDD
ncbi:MAG: 1-(5-phosphoribosyl)-5-((5-phosphoribosylamino)methylideneamino)imidazole-4-carboxamide isomerase [Acidimicrobiia bacterium]|nr:1-(5-phosphoribosyl)-5-((5-phosphoribosylamino)methylideneamino)imidazole-4-carboxamide isomerase [Acidimicrobiia bacterium]